MIASALQTKIFISYVGVLFIATLIGGLVTILSESEHVDSTTVSVSDTLTDNELSSLQERLTTITLTTSALFGQMVGDLTYAHDYAVTVFSNGFPVESYYTNYDVTTTPVPALDANGINSEYSFWYKDTDKSDNPHLDNSSLLDNSHGTIFRANPAYAGIYMGYEYGGLWRHFPYMDVAESLETKTYVCSYNGVQVTGYDPRCRGWYYAAKNNRLDTRFSSPYEDASTERVMITLSRAVELGDDDPSLLGVVASDVTLDSLGEIVLAATILDDGYTYLCDGQKQLVVHPDIEDPNLVYSVESLEFPTGGADAAAFDKLLDEHVLEGETGQTLFEKDGEPWYVTYGPVSGTPYFALMVVPEANVVEPAVTVEAYSSVSIAALVGIVCIVLAVVLVVGSLLAHRFSAMITAPVLVFTRVLSDIKDIKLNSDGSGGADLEENGDDFDEVSNLRSKIGNLFMAVKFSTDAYYKNDYEKALKFLTEVEEMFTVIDQQRALGVIFNNRGNILRKHKGEQDKFASSLEYLERAVKNIQVYADKARSDLVLARDPKSGNQLHAHMVADSVVVFEKILASRLANLGDCFRAAGMYEQGKEALAQSLKLFSQHEDMQGQLQAKGNIGLLKLAQGNDAGAEAEFADALDMADVRFKNEVNYETVSAVQFAAMNMGNYYYKAATRHAMGDRMRTNLVEKALSFLYYALTVCDRVHRAVQMQSLVTLAIIYKSEYGEAGWTAIGSLCKMYPQFAKQLSSVGGVTNINFLIDVSASMWGSRIKATVRVLQDLVNNRMKHGDKMSLLSFASELKTVVECTKLDSNSLPIVNEHLFSLIKSCTVGRTFFFKSLLAMARSLVAANPEGPHVIVALTDGEDNERITSAKDVKAYLEEHEIQLVVISVGVDEVEVIKTLSFLASNEKYYIKAAADPDSIAAALTQGFELALDTGNLVIESF